MNAKEAQDKSFQAQQEIEEGIEQGGAAIADKARKFKDTAQQWSRQATDSSRRAAQATDEYVRQNPWGAIACVALGCFTLGYMLGCKD